MANAIYNKGRQAFMSGSINMASDDIRCVLVDLADYTANLATDDFLADIPGGARVATSSALSSKSVTDGIFDAADVTFTAVTGDPSEALVLYKHTGSDATAILIAYFDTATGLPVTPNGGNITITWDNGSNKIFKL